MKRTLTLAVLLLIPLLHVSAQKGEFGLRAGLNLSNQIGDIDMKIKPAFNVGMVVDVNGQRSFFFQPGLLYSLKGSKDSGYISNVKVDQTIQMHYIEVPLSVGWKFKTGGNALFVVQTGPYFAAAVAGRLITESGVKTYGGGGKESHGVIGDVFKRGDIGWNGGIGIRGSHMFLGVQYGIGILNTSKDTGSGIYNYHKTKIRNSNLSLNVAYYF
ncbi:MAG: PorT family protein [Rikenellaceae bacterium]|nr:PorT family protein [Rikenellaceae bacterium]